VSRLIVRSIFFGNLDDALNRAPAELGEAPGKPPLGATPTVGRETPIGGVP